MPGFVDPAPTVIARGEADEAISTEPRWDDRALLRETAFGCFVPTGKRWRICSDLRHSKKILSSGRVNPPPGGNAQ
jgi:hypothetical protein